MDRKQKDGWFDTVSYVLITLFIVIFILAIVQNREELLAVLMVLLLILCVSLLFYGLRQRRLAENYRKLRKWMQEADLDDRDALPPELQE